MAGAKKSYLIPMIVGHFMILLGLYLLTAGLIENYSFVDVFRSSIFSGLLLIMLAVLYPLRAIGKLVK